jgi:hypothetical protein
MIVLDRWATVTGAFGPHLQLSRRAGILNEAAARVRSAEELLVRANALLDGSDGYAPEAVEACLLAWQSVGGVFEEERAEAEQMSKLGPMQSEDYKEARQIFLQDLAAR